MQGLSSDMSRLGLLGQFRGKSVYFPIQKVPGKPLWGQGPEGPAQHCPSASGRAGPSLPQPRGCVPPGSATAPGNERESAGLYGGGEQAGPGGGTAPR